jgi:hypothetical protein
MFTDSPNSDDRLVETDVLFEIREEGKHISHVLHNVRPYTSLYRRCPPSITCHSGAGPRVADGKDCGVQKLDGLETAISSANVPYRYVAETCGTYFPANLQPVEP